MGAVICGYFGLLLMSGVYISIGLFASSVTQNQIVAFLTALFIGLFFHLIFNVLAGSFTGILGQIFDYLSMSTHFQSISRGVIDTRDLIYFGTLMVFGLYFAELSLSRRNAIN
jgi:ABC-2 type transport system permease protein